MSVLGTASEKKRSLNSRKLQYKFGTKNLNFVKPTNRYPSGSDLTAKPKGALEISHVYGYNGFNSNSTNNLIVSNCGNYLIYHIAAICVVYDIKKKTQKYFTAHSDDVTAICIDERKGSSLVASGQTLPIDRPSFKKDLPCVWVWDLQNMSKVEKIDKVCFNYVSKIKWSKKSGHIYVLAGNEEHTLKAFDVNDFKSNYIQVEKDYADPKKKKNMTNVISELFWNVTQ
jgi:hypothetical protein